MRGEAREESARHFLGSPLALNLKGESNEEAYRSSNPVRRVRISSGDGIGAASTVSTPAATTSASALSVVVPVGRS